MSMTWFSRHSWQASLKRFFGLRGITAFDPLRPRAAIMGLVFFIAGWAGPVPFHQWFSLEDVIAVAAPADKADELRFPDEPPPEPQGYKLDNYRSIVPLTLSGATVVSDTEAFKLYERGDVVFIDVMPFVPRPPNLPKGMIWRDKKRANIKGSSWLANVGYGRLPDEMARYFKTHLKRLSSGDFAKPLLFYCQKNCWMSWNAAKRALQYGYQNVYWYPDGTDGWVTVGGSVVAAKPLPLPDMTRALKPASKKD